MYSYMNAWLRFFNPTWKKQEKNNHLKPGVIHFHVRREVAKQVFESDYNKLGRFIQVTKEQYEELFEIEGGKLNPDTKRDKELVTKIKQILCDAVD